MGDNERRRRRQRHPADRPVPAPPPSDVDDELPSAVTPEVHDPEPTPAPAPAPRRPDPIESRPRRPAGQRPMGGLPPSEEREAERGLRGLVGSGASQVDITAAMRARDASRPSAAEEAQALDRLVVVRRNWVPREDLPRGGRPAR